MHATVKLCDADGTPAERRVYASADSAQGGDEHTVYPAEFLHKLNVSGLPPHELHLQVGAPIILLRNMTNGLANGTRLIVRRLRERVIEAEVATGPRKGQCMFIPRITFEHHEDLPFTLRRRQFPVRPAFALTINKSQGQTFKQVGIYLPKPVFSHGQLYVALSRVGCWAAVRVLLGAVGVGRVGANGCTKNVVYEEVFQD
jgi:ATP-dependent DNA helicase PIF1